MSKQEVNQQAEETELTEVSVKSTYARYFCENEGQVKENTFLGKVSTADLKKLLKAEEESNVLIEKKSVTEKFNVNTVALYQLKEA